MIECKDLSLIYKDGETKNTIFKGLDLNINKGEKVILLGPSGSGKSSLVYLLSGLRKPSTGSIKYNNIQINSLSDIENANLRKNEFGFIFQMHFLISYLSVIENVIVGHKDKDKSEEKHRDEVKEALKELGIADCIDKRIYQLSGGQRQRVAIARALISRPKVIFADEPTASLDHNNSIDVYKLIKSYDKDSILIMATHDTSILTGDERIVRIDEYK